MNINFISIFLPLPVEPHWTTPAAARLYWRGWWCKFTSEKCIFENVVLWYPVNFFLYFPIILVNLIAMRKLVQKQFLCVFLQGDCGEGCSQGLPGVPGTAGDKGEKGDIGKPGVTPLDSCDKVRLWGTGSSSFKTFSASLYDSPYQESYVTPLIVRSLCLLLCSDQCKMAIPHIALYSSLRGLMWEATMLTWYRAGSKIDSCNLFSCRLPSVWRDCRESRRQKQWSVEIIVIF